MARIRALPSHHSLRFRPENYFIPLNWDDVFETNRPLEIELGAGDGSFLIRYAASRPEINLLGIERLLGRMRKIDRDTHRSGVKNVQLFRIEAGYFLTYLAPPKSVQAIHVYFPDPWPKIRHHKKRLINEEFVEKCAQILEPNGSVYLRTDHLNYFRQMQKVFLGDERFKPTDTPNSLKAIKTDFEAHFNQLGIQTQYANYQL
ncbi:MAG: tRNA (guanosine(46)-N7)-methyltransferase TrmB, partial [Verrucomicrobia bacterium]|nr:tRNA (guanosine(46)-N7)-methyltransferase TrmB [Verrucomicrobiota bacterium]